MVPCMFATSYVYAPRRAFYHPSKACASCGPCQLSSNPLLFLLGVMFLPFLFRTLFFAVGFLILNVVPFIIVALLTRALLNDACGDGSDLAWRSRCHSKTRVPDEKTEKAQGTGETDVDPAVICEASSSPSVHVGDDKLTVVLAVPGLRSADLDLQVIDDHVLRVTGTTKKGDVVYTVARDIKLPVLGTDEVSAKYEDGVLSITVKRKFCRVHIPITSEATEKEEAEVENGEDGEGLSEHEVADEWEPLPMQVASAPSTI